jgi:hypothetical protein
MDCMYAFQVLPLLSSWSTMFGTQSVSSASLSAPWMPAVAAT